LQLPKTYPHKLALFPALFLESEEMPPKLMLITVLIALSLPIGPYTVQAQEPGSGRPIVFGNFGSDNYYFNPFFNDNLVTRSMFPFLVGQSGFTQYFARVGELGVRNALATDWTISEDGRVYTFSLRQDAVWSDGKPITATDVKFSFDARASGVLESTFPAYDPQFNPTGIKEINILDDYTVQAVYEEPNCGALLSGFYNFSVAPAHAFDYDGSPDFDFSAVLSREFDTQPSVVYGPFELESLTMGEEIRLKAVDTWADGTITPAGVIFRNVDDAPDQVERLLAGELHYAYDGVPIELRSQVRAASTVTTYSYPSVGWEYIGLNLADPTNPQPGLDDNGDLVDQGHHPILGDRQVRRALQHALDVQAIIEQALFGEGTVMAANTIPTSWTLDPNLAPVPHNPDLAAQMLDEAGWPVGPDGIRLCDGCRYAEDKTAFEFTLMINEGVPHREAVAKIVRSQLAELGVVVNIQVMPWPDYLDTLFAQTFDAYMGRWNEIYPDEPDPLMFSPESDLLSYAGYNAISYYHPDIARLSEEAGTLPGCDPAARAEIYHQIQQILQDDQPYLWLYALNDFVAISAEVQGFDPIPIDPMWNMHTWYIAPGAR
jgi:peptide/nickel transport system substrate-binding protein